MMKRIILSTVLVWGLLVSWALAEKQEYSLDLSASTEYTDNLYLTQTDTVEDWMSLFTADFSATHSARLHSIIFNYEFTRAQYWRFPENNTNRHSLSLNYNQNLSQRLALGLGISYYKSEEPIERNPEIFRERIGQREQYYRINIFHNISYNFAPGSVLELGANINYLQNESPETEDSRIYSEFIKITKDFTSFFVSMGFRGSQREFETSPQVNTWGYDLSAGYHIAHNKDLSLTYTAERTQDYGPGVNDYWVYNIQTTYTYRPSPDQTYYCSVGYYKRVSDDSSGDDNGLTYSLGYAKKFRRTTFTLDGSGGYRYEYGEAENPGFTKYYLISASISHQFTKTLSGSLQGMYRNENFKNENREEDTYSFSLSLQKQLLKKLFLSADYSYRKRDSSGTNTGNILDESYEENVVHVTLTYQFWRGRSLW